MEAAWKTVAARRDLRLSRLVVVKAGMPVVTHVNGDLALGRICSIIEQIAMLRNQQRDVILVTSGAISIGQFKMRAQIVLNRALGDTVKNHVHIDRNAASSVGQSKLMAMYEMGFAKFNVGCGQVLVSHEDLDDPAAYSNICEACADLLKGGLVPIVNANHIVSTGLTPAFDEVTREVSSDNDALASRIAASLRADVLIMLTDMDALYCLPDGASEPTRLSLWSAEAKLVRMGIRALESDGAFRLSDKLLTRRNTFAGRTRMSEAGLQALVSATVGAVSCGVRAAVVTSGLHPLALLQVTRGDDVGTIFVPGRSEEGTAVQIDAKL